MKQGESDIIPATIESERPGCEPTMLKPMHCELITRPMPVHRPRGELKTKDWIANTFVAYACRHVEKVILEMEGQLKE